MVINHSVVSACSCCALVVCVCNREPTKEHSKASLVLHAWPIVFDRLKLQSFHVLEYSSKTDTSKID